MKSLRILGLFAAIGIMMLAGIITSTTSGCGGGGGAGSGSEVVGYGDVAGGVSLENLTTARSFESSASLAPVPMGPTQKSVAVPAGLGMKVVGYDMMVTDSAVSGIATLYNLEGEEVASAEIVEGEYTFSEVPATTYKLVLTLATPEAFDGMEISSFVEIEADSVITPRPDPLSTIMVEAAEYKGNEYGITGNALDGFDLDTMVTKIRDCYETMGDVGIESGIGAADLSGLDFSTIAAMFEELPDTCKTLGYTSFARGRLLAAGNNPKKVTQALCDILYRLGFIIQLHEPMGDDPYEPQKFFCHPDYEGSPFTWAQITENYCPEGDPTGCADWGGFGLSAVPGVVEKDRNRRDDDPGFFLPVVHEYRVMTMAQAYVDGVTVDASAIYHAMVDTDDLGLRLCFDSGRGSQYCFGTDGEPVINMVYGEDEMERLSAADTMPPTCHELLPVFCDEGEAIGDFASKAIGMDEIKENIIFRRVHMPWNMTGGPYEYVVFDGDPWAGNDDALPVRVNVTRSDDYEITGVAQAVDGKWYLGFDENTHITGSTRPINVETGREMMDKEGRNQKIYVDDVEFLEGVSVKETGNHIYGGPPVEINSWIFGVIYDNWQGEDAAPIEVCVAYTDHYTVVQNDNGVCDDSIYYLQWHETTETDNSSYLLNSATGDCSLTNPEAEESEDNQCIKWPLADVLGLNEFEYRDTHTYTFGGQVANPQHDPDRDPYFDDFPADLCNVDADGDGKQDDGDGIACSQTLADSGLCDVVEPAFAWRPYLANPDAPYSGVPDDYYRWAAGKQFVREEGGDVQAISCGDQFQWDMIPPHPDDPMNILPGGEHGDGFDFQASPATNGLVARNFKSRLNTYAVGRPYTMINMASLALGGKKSVGPLTTFNVIEAYAMIYMAWNVETNVTVDEITIPNYEYDPETGQEVDATLMNEVFHAMFFRPWSDEQEFHDPFQVIMDAFGVPENYLEGSNLWEEYDW